jgi:hypothetical protein
MRTRLAYFGPKLSVLEFVVGDVSNPLDDKKYFFVEILKLTVFQNLFRPLVSMKRGKLQSK